MQKISPFLWFDSNAEEAVNFYTSIFKESKIETVVRYSEAGPGPAGSVMTVSFELFGQNFVALNGGPIYKFTEAISFVINCHTQEEVDDYWEKLSAGGQIQQCGWLKDKFGLSWQVVPIEMIKLFQGEPKKSQKAMQAMMQMKKLDINVLKKAYEEG
ncbi:MAG: VOC family protein [Sphingobacteriaceae bacterium]|nr:VOC family protein [Sphingobacteriaceae bacterium]